MFVSHGNKKGEVLLSVLKKEQFLTVRRILFIDDRVTHLQDVDESIRLHGTNKVVYPVLCTFLKDKRESYNREEAWQQLMHYMRKNNDAAFADFIRGDYYSLSLLGDSK